MTKSKYIPFFLTVSLAFIAMLQNACRHEPVIPTDVPVVCDMSDVNFISTIDPILQNNCYGCHNNLTPNGGIDLTDFSVLSGLVINGKLSAVINRESGFEPMPPGFALDSCFVQQIDQWIADTIPTIAPCDTLNVSYPETIYPILQANCITCHSGPNPEGNLDLTDYNQLAIVAQNGALMGSIQHIEGYSPMPKGAAMLDDCSITQIGIWVRDTTFTPPNEGHPCDPDTVYFQNQVLPLIISTCATAECHDGTNDEIDRVFLDYASIIDDGDVKPGDPFDSKLYKVLVKDEPDDRMPPPPAEALSQEQTDLVKKWIEQGALNNACDEACDTVNVTFSASVWPTIETNCVGCHSGDLPGGGIPITNFSELVTIADNGKLVGAIKHETGFSPMPKNGLKLTDCKIKQIEIWIADGTPNN